MDRACNEARRVCKRGGSCIFTVNAIRNYPHVRKYHELAARLLGWSTIEVNTSRFCVEVMEEVLSPHFSHVNIIVREGLLRLPADEFVRWFTSMLDNWHPSCRARSHSGGDRMRRGPLSPLAAGTIGRPDLSAAEPSGRLGGWSSGTAGYPAAGRLRWSAEARATLCDG